LKTSLVRPVRGTRTNPIEIDADVSNCGSSDASSGTDADVSFIGDVDPRTLVYIKMNRQRTNRIINNETSTNTVKTIINDLCTTLEASAQLGRDDDDDDDDDDVVVVVVVVAVVVAEALLAEDGAERN